MASKKALTTLVVAARVPQVVFVDRLTNFPCPSDPSRHCYDPGCQRQVISDQHRPVAAIERSQAQCLSYRLDPIGKLARLT